MGQNEDGKWLVAPCQHRPAAGVLVAASAAVTAGTALGSWQAAPLLPRPCGLLGGRQAAASYAVMYACDVAVIL